MIFHSKTNPILVKNKKLIRPKDIDLQISSSNLFKKDTLWKEKFNLDDSINYFYNEIKKKYEFKQKKI